MRRYRLVVFLVSVIASACGGNTTSPSAPTPPPPTTITIAGTITDTVSRATVGSFSQVVSTLPAFVTVSTAGYLTRTARIGSTSPVVDLFPTAAPFDQAFYAQLARGALDGYDSALLIRTESPAIYLQDAGLSDAQIAAYADAARNVVPALTGNRLAVVSFEHGATLRPDAPNWIIIEQVNEPDGGSCGHTVVGSGHVYLNMAARCRFDPALEAHEIGHALGFWHDNTAQGALMTPTQYFGVAMPNDIERYHAALAYSRSPGNTDPDNDASTATPLAVRGIRLD